MPIKDKSRYPPNWPAIRAAILQRSGFKCEGSPRYPDCRAAQGEPHPVTGSRVVLTCAHLDHTPETDDPELIKALCQRCHLTYDAAHHAETARRTRERRAGQERLL